MSTTLTTTDFGDVHWFLERNTVRSAENRTVAASPKNWSGHDKSTATSFAQHLWKIDEPITVRKISKEDAKAAVAWRTERLANLRGAASTDPSTFGMVLAVAERAWLDNNGKVRVPKYEGITGNRRMQLYPFGVAMRLTETDTTLGVPGPSQRRNGENDRDYLDRMVSDLTVPVIVRTFSNELEELECRLVENDQKAIGAVKLNDGERLGIAMNILRLGGKQADLRRHFTPTTGQKMYGICVLARRFENLNLIDRLTDHETHKPKADGSGLVYSKITGSELPGLVAASSPIESDLTSWNEGKSEAKQLPRMDATAIDQRLRAMMLGGDNKKKVMKGDDIRGLAETVTGNPSALAVLNAVIEDDTSKAAMAIEVSPAVAAVHEIRNQNAEVFPGLTEFLVALASVPAEVQAETVASLRIKEPAATRSTKKTGRQTSAARKTRK